MTGRRLLNFAFVLFAASGGCTLAPKSFVQANDPAPLVRARAIGLSRSLPNEQAIPALIGMLDDDDGVVRLAAIEQLKLRTGRDLGYPAWGDPAERAPAIAAWQAWWNSARPGVYASSQQPTRVTPATRRLGLFRRR
jgi:hypothetical protein